METAPLHEVAWIGKEEAARLLDKSIRTVLNMAKDGTIKSKLERNPETGHKNVLFHAGDVARLQHQRDNPGTDVEVSRKPASKEIAPLHVPAFSPIHEAPATPRPWLTLEQAADYSGLPEGFIVELVQSHRLPALNVGRRAGGQWRVSRRDLDAIRAPESMTAPGAVG